MPANCKKAILLLFFLFLNYFQNIAQPFGNEWINYSQNYYKFPVLSTGIHKISYTALQNAGIPITTINPKNIPELFGRGKEIPLYIEGEADGVFNPSDFIEFFAEKNDGWFDSLVYDNPQHIGNPYYSLFNDSAYYFLTWNNSTLNERMVIENDTINFNLYGAEPFCWAKYIGIFSDTYYAGETNGMEPPIRNTHRPKAGFAQNGKLGAKAENLLTKNVYANGPPATIKTKIIGASNAANFQNDNRIKIELIGANTTQLSDFIFDGYTVHDLTYTAANSDLGSTTTQLKYTTLATGAPHLQYTGLAYNSIEYAHTFDFESNYFFRFKLPIKYPT